VGVLSSSDFVTWAGEGGEGSGGERSITAFIAPWGEAIDIEEAPDTEIRRYMTARLITVAPMTPIGELAQKMAQAHIHRLLVVVDHDRPRGIVTSTDILTAVARAAQRAPSRGEG
jgi:CBS domain-containing protein